MKSTHLRSTAFRRTLVTLLLLALAASAHAAYFTVTLKNGTTFDIRYNPVKADWDPRYTMFLTDQGNWIATLNTDIADIVSHAEESGYGYQLNTTTLFLGWSPNDLVTDEVDAEGNVTTTSQYEAGADVGGADYSIDQFLNIQSADPSAMRGGGFSVVPVVNTGGEN